MSSKIRWALIGIGKDCLNKSGKLSAFLSKRSFAFFSVHYIPIVLMQYLISGIFMHDSALMYLVPVVFAYIVTFIVGEVFVRIPFLSFLIGVKPLKN